MRALKWKTVHDELEEVRQSHAAGLLVPGDVVEYAKNPATALHKRFEWNDGIASAQYRLWQARTLIRLHVTVINSDVAPVRAYVSLKRDRVESGGGYRPLGSVMSEKQLRAELLAQALEELEVFRRKYQDLVELAPIFEAMEKAKKRRKRRAGATS